MIAFIHTRKIEIFADVESVRHGRPIETLVSADVARVGTSEAPVTLMGAGYFPTAGLTFAPYGPPRHWTIEVAKVSH